MNIAQNIFLKNLPKWS